MDFRSGDAVEVSSNEEGFRGAWFEARVVRSMPKLKRYIVVYDSIVEETDASKNLRETVDAAHIRPRPLSARGGIFAIKEHVDVFYQDGWWEGIVFGLSGSKRRKTYNVSFPATGDLMEFMPSELRVRSDWVDGKWVTPCAQDAPLAGSSPTEDLLKKMFEPGASVEVSSDDEGFRGAWFPATIVSFVGKKFLVEYRNLMTDDETEPLKETVDSLHIRPAPPAIPVSGKFKNLEEVDAYYNDGWWVGVISKVLRDSKYMIYFKAWMQEMEFSCGELRPHHDWIGGSWFQASQELGFKH